MQKLSEIAETIAPEENGNLTDTRIVLTAEQTDELQELFKEASAKNTMILGTFRRDDDAVRIYCKVVARKTALEIIKLAENEKGEPDNAENTHNPTK
jgi:Mg/Co/Ni transporter MgtE